MHITAFELAGFVCLYLFLMPIDEMCVLGDKFYAHNLYHTLKYS